MSPRTLLVLGEQVIKCAPYLQQAIFVMLHFFDGTHKLDDPVSKMTLKF